MDTKYYLIIVNHHHNYNFIKELFYIIFQVKKMIKNKRFWAREEEGTKLYVY